MYRVRLQVSLDGQELDRTFEIEKEGFYMSESRELVCLVCGAPYPCHGHPRQLRAINNVFELKLRLPDRDIPDAGPSEE